MVMGIVVMFYQSMYGIDRTAVNENCLILSTLLLFEVFLYIYLNREWLFNSESNE